jgi:TPR repeat protein
LNITNSIDHFAVCYFLGRGVPNNLEKATALFQSRVEMESSKSMINLLVATKQEGSRAKLPKSN